MAKPVVSCGGRGRAVLVLRRWRPRRGRSPTEQSDGAFFVFEDEMVRGKTTPYHLHADETECVTCSSGEILVNIDGDEQVVGQGGFTMTPPGDAARVHRHVRAERGSWRCTRPVPARRSTWVRANPRLRSSRPPGPSTSTASAASAARTGGMQVLGPPPFTRSDVRFGACSHRTARDERVVVLGHRHERVAVGLGLRRGRRAMTRRRRSPTRPTGRRPVRCRRGTFRRG